MLHLSRTPIYLFTVTFVFVSILVLSGCSPASTLTPVSEAVTVPPSVAIDVHPDVSEVPVGEQIAISAETKGINLQIRWRVKRGELSNSEGPSTIYIAPDEPGPDTVDVIVTGDDGGTTTRTVVFTIVALDNTTPTSTSVALPTSTPPAPPAETPIPPPTSTPTVSPPPAPDIAGAIELNLADFVAQDGDGDGIAEEFLLDARFGAISGLSGEDGVDLSNFVLEFTFEGGNGKQVQLWFKDKNWANVYSFPYPITSSQSIRFDPLTDGRNVDQFDDFGHIYAIGAKVLGGVEGVQIISARLIPKSGSPTQLESASEGASATPKNQPLADVSSENKLPPIIEGEFVTRQGGTLMLGDRPFFFVGTNAYFLQPEMAYGNSADVTETLDTMVALGMPVVRIWAFNDHDPAMDPAAIQIEPGMYREEGLVALDKVVAEAKKRKVRLILTLINYWPDYGGVNRYVEWYQVQCNCDASIADFYSNEIIKGWYKDYAQMLLSRTNTVTGIKYKDESTFLAIELGNELRNPSRSPDELLAWQEEMAAFIKNLAPQILVADGGEGFDDDAHLYPELSNTYSVRGDEGASYRRLVHAENIDLASYHLYPGKWGLNNDSDVEIWIRVHEELAQRAGKVAYLGEFGVMGSDVQRAGVFDRWLTTALTDNQSAGALVWGLAYQNRPDYDKFTVYCPEHVESCAVLCDHATGLGADPGP